MSRISFQIAIIALLVCSSYAYKGVDLSQLFTQADFNCLKNQQGMHFAVIRGYCSFGGMDHNAVQSLTYSKNAGLITDVYLFPCRSKSATAQVNEMFANIPNNLFGMVWLDIETNPSTGCSFSGHDGASNCAFIAQLVSAIKAKGKNAGIYASLYMWESILGSRNACPTVASQPLWYAHYDNNPSFSDFTSFGGWTKPAIKQYKGTTTLCGASVDLNFY